MRDYRVTMSGDGRDLLDGILSDWIEEQSEGFADELVANYWRDDDPAVADAIAADARMLARAASMLMQLREQKGGSYVNEGVSVWWETPGSYIQHSPEECPGRPCGSECDHKERL